MPTIQMKPNNMTQRAPVQERTILRVACEIKEDQDGVTNKNVRKEILLWAKKRLGRALPQDAWSGNEFECLAGGRTVMGIRQLNDSSDVWALRANDPDKDIAGRNWTTEVAIGKAKGSRHLLGVRLLVNTTENVLNIEPHVPGFLQQIAVNIGLLLDDYEITPNPRIIDSNDDIDLLVEMLEDPMRSIPVFVATGDERTHSPNQPLIDVDILTRATIGLAHVVVIPAEYTFLMSRILGQQRSTYHGGIRIYMPGFDKNSNPYDHKLFLGQYLKTDEEKTRCVRTLRMIAARHSLIRRKLNRDVISFSSLRSAVRKLQQEQQAVKGASYIEQLEAAQQRIEAIGHELQEAKNWEIQLSQEHDLAEKQARLYKDKYRISTIRIQSLIEQLNSDGRKINAEILHPNNWSDFPYWCEENLVGQLMLTSYAKRQIKKTNFKDVSLAARCLIWLGNEYRYSRIHGNGDLRGPVTEHDMTGLGIRNDRCGSDSFSFDFDEDNLEADWHLKNGGNTRSPDRCLRIYYCWHPELQQVIIADMPGHRDTAIT